MLAILSGGGEKASRAEAGEGLPREFFIFVDQANPMAQHNYRFTKTFTSRFADRLYSVEGQRALDDGRVDPMPFAPNVNADPSLSPFAVRAMNDYRIEWDAELARRAIVPRAPSRMSAVFAFGDLQSCIAVNQSYGWPLESVRRFELVDPERSRVARVNMEVISLMRATYPLASGMAAGTSTRDLAALLDRRRGVDGRNGRICGTVRLGPHGIAAWCGST